MLSICKLLIVKVNRLKKRDEILSFVRALMDLVCSLNKRDEKGQKTCDFIQM